MRYDAALTALQFVDANNGWAVGDRGVIWHTSDGGTTWQQQQSTITCNLTGVFFIDAKRGWAVGGESRPLQATTRGAILRTEDGGANWRALPQSVLPRLAGVKFFDHERGIAFGDCSSMSPSGVFTTRDSGNTWQPLATDRAGSWLAGDFLDADLGAVAGTAGSLANLNRHRVVHSPLAASSQRAFRAMKLVAPTGGWAVGDGGLIMTTHDAGRSWQTPTGESPVAAADYFDFYAVAIVSSHIWVAGSPGSQVFHSSDNGRSWESLATGITTPLRALTFVDAMHGWAVGELGNILATTDGGHTWHAQRSGGQRAALLALFAEPTDVPLELLSQYGAAEGHIVAVNTLTTPASAASARGGASITSATGTFDSPHRAAQAFLLAGAASTHMAWRFPLPPADLALAPADMLQALNRENDGRAMQQLESYIVRSLRTWRPDVVVTKHSTTAKESSFDAFLERLVLHAIDASADAAQQQELASVTKLTPWAVKKTYGLLPLGERGDELLATGRFSPWLGAALADFAAPARDLLYATHQSPPDNYELKLLRASIAEQNNARGIFAGISLASGSDARRPQADLPTQDLDSLRKLAARRRHLQELMERSEGNAAWAAQVSKMIDGLPSEDGGQLLTQLAEGYRKTGRLDLAADTYFLLARSYPDHPLVDQALDWLIHFYASSELAQRFRTTPSPSGRGQGEGVLESSPPIQQTSALIPMSPALTRDDRLRRAAQLADYLKTARPSLYAEPAVRFAETTAQRELGYANPAQRFFLTLNQLPESDPWRQCANAEQWLVQPNENPPANKLANCRRAAQPPRLDGHLNETFWESADHLQLGDSSVGRIFLSAPHRPTKDDDKDATAPTAFIQLAHDDQCLYVAIRCPKCDSCSYEADDTPRPHDADLTQHDRVTLRLDTDRDYTTAFELTVDHRGWVADACWGDATWNPQWFVAAANDDESWTVETAVPLAELAEKPPAARQVWAVSAQRTIPRVGYQSWAGPPASDSSPNQFGLVIFE